MSGASSSTPGSSSAGRAEIAGRPFDEARRLFDPIAPGYERWSRILSLGQDPRWRRIMVARLEVPKRARVLDVAAGTGSISRLLASDGATVVAVDQSREMLGRHRGGTPVRGRAEMLPFADESFDVVTFGYLLRYVPDPVECLRELARVTRAGGALGMVEFGRPSGAWHLPWQAYTRVALPAFGRMIGAGWFEVGRFLGGSIEAFHRRHSADDLRRHWQEAGLTDVRTARPSLGGGLVMWGHKR